MKDFKFPYLAVLLTVSVLLIVACDSRKGTSLKPTDVTFYISEIEIKGATDGIAPPDIDPTTLSKGYRFKPPGKYDPNNPKKWQVSSYMFSPAFMSVFQGDTITLQVFVLNGDKHVNWVEAPDGSVAVPEHISNRGREYKTIFKAEQAGYYYLRCDEHEPTMRAVILSMPR